jgi:hypothetical protein
MEKAEKRMSAEEHLTAAEVEFSKAIELNPLVATYWKSRGEARYLLHDFSGAHRDFKKSLGLDPSQADVTSRLSQFEPSLTSLRSTACRVEAAKQSNGQTAEWAKGPGAGPELLGYGGGKQGGQQGGVGRRQRGGDSSPIEPLGITGVGRNSSSSSVGSVGGGEGVGVGVGGPSGTRAFPSPTPKGVLKSSLMPSASEMKHVLFPAIEQSKYSARGVVAIRVEETRTKKDAVLWGNLKVMG